MKQATETQLPRARLSDIEGQPRDELRTTARGCRSCHSELTEGPSSGLVWPEALRLCGDLMHVASGGTCGQRGRASCRAELRAGLLARGLRRAVCARRRRRKSRCSPAWASRRNRRGWGAGGDSQGAGTVPCAARRPAPRTGSLSRPLQQLAFRFPGRPPFGKLGHLSSHSAERQKRGWHAAEVLGLYSPPASEVRCGPLWST